MIIKFIKLPINTTEKNAEMEFKKIGYNTLKFNIDRRTRAKHKVIEVIRNHNKYKENFNNTLLFEGLISILNRKDFWIGKPDYIIWNDKEIYFCELKSKGDNFRLNQIEWFEKFEMLPNAIALAIKEDYK